MKKHITAVAALAGSLLFAPVLMNQANAGGHGGGEAWATWAEAWATWAEAWATWAEAWATWAEAWATWAAEHISPEGTWAAATLAEAE